MAQKKKRATTKKKAGGKKKATTKRRSNSTKTARPAAKSEGKKRSTAKRKAGSKRSTAAKTKRTAAKKQTAAKVKLEQIKPKRISKGSAREVLGSGSQLVPHVFVFGNPFFGLIAGFFGGVGIIILLQGKFEEATQLKWAWIIWFFYFVHRIYQGRKLKMAVELVASASRGVTLKRLANRLKTKVKRLEKLIAVINKGCPNYLFVRDGDRWICTTTDVAEVGKNMRWLVVQMGAYLYFFVAFMIPHFKNTWQDQVLTSVAISVFGLASGYLLENKGRPANLPLKLMSLKQYWSQEQLADYYDDHRSELPLALTSVTTVHSLGFKYDPELGLYHDSLANRIVNVENCPSCSKKIGYKALLLKRNSFECPSCGYDVGLGKARKIKHKTSSEEQYKSAVNKTLEDLERRRKAADDTSDNSGPGYIFVFLLFPHTVVWPAMAIDDSLWTTLIFFPIWGLLFWFTFLRPIIKNIPYRIANFVNAFPVLPVAEVAVYQKISADMMRFLLWIARERSDLFVYDRHKQMLYAPALAEKTHAVTKCDSCGAACNFELRLANDYEELPDCEHCGEHPVSLNHWNEIENKAREEAYSSRIHEVVQMKGWLLAKGILFAIAFSVYMYAVKRHF